MNLEFELVVVCICIYEIVSFIGARYCGGVAWFGLELELELKGVLEEVFDIICYILHFLFIF